MAEWFESWFDDDYLALYPHRNEAEAERHVALIERMVRGMTVNRVLDLACGAGRHTRSLSDRWWTTGLDLSEALLERARESDLATPLVRGDIRELPFRDGTFDLVVNLFTSFGYFDTDAEHRAVIREVGRATAAGGTFILDFLNADLVERTLVPYDRKENEGRIVEQRRSIEDGRFIVKRISIDGEDREFVERVRLYSLEELRAMLRNDGGFTISEEFGDYEGSSFTEESPRLILVGRRR